MDTGYMTQDSRKRHSRTRLRNIHDDSELPQTNNEMFIFQPGWKSIMEPDTTMYIEGQTLRQSPHQRRTKKKPANTWTTSPAVAKKDDDERLREVHAQERWAEQKANEQAVEER